MGSAGVPTGFNLPSAFGRCGHAGPDSAWLDSIVFELGEGRLRDDVELSQLNGGFGIERGSIVVTNRSGTESVVDLSQAATIGEVVDAINGAGLSVEASLQSGSLNLLDTSGGSGTFSVRGFNGSNTAEDLGISSSINGDAIEGDLIWSLAGNTELGVLRDGLGVRIQDGGLPDLTIQLSLMDHLQSRLIWGQ